jgi:hypothetical protein
VFRGFPGKFFSQALKTTIYKIYLLKLEYLSIQVKHKMYTEAPTSRRLDLYSEGALLLDLGREVSIVLCECGAVLCTEMGPGSVLQSFWAHHL